MNIYVGNLSYSMTDSGLEEVFAAFGPVTSCKIITDKETGRSKGFGFVEMQNNNDGEEAIKKLNGSDVQGRNIVVNVAKAREERPRRQRY